MKAAQTPTPAKLNKRNSKRSVTSIPLQTLGFKAKVFYDVHDYVPRRRYNKTHKYDRERRKENFKSQLSFVICPLNFESQAQVPSFCKRAEWNQVQFIVYKSREELTCCICMEECFVAPQMTFCGHVFCWHCILMHYEKSLKGSNCPACNEAFTIEELKTCENLYLPPFEEGSRVRLKLKLRNICESVVYSPETLLQEALQSNVIRMSPENIREKFEAEHLQILEEMKKQEDPETQKFLLNVAEKSNAKIEKFKKEMLESKRTFKSGKNEAIENGCIVKQLELEGLSCDSLCNFYQEEHGRRMFLHPICEKYLRKTFQTSQLPLMIDEKIVLKEDTEYSMQHIKKCKYLNHLRQNQNFVFVFLEMKELLSKESLAEFKVEVDRYKKKKEDIIRREELIAKRLNQQFEKDQLYIRELKRMEESEFYDINVPTNMVDMSEIEDTSIFPSLYNSQSPQKPLQHPEQSPTGKKTNKKGFQLDSSEFPLLDLERKSTQGENSSVQQSDSFLQTAIVSVPSVDKKSQTKEFPGLSDLCLKGTKSEQPPKPIGKKDRFEQEISVSRRGKKKKKQKFVDVTAQFFNSTEENQY